MITEYEVNKFKGCMRNIIEKAQAILKELDGYDEGLYVGIRYINEKNEIILGEAKCVKSCLEGEEQCQQE